MSRFRMPELETNASMAIVSPSVRNPVAFPVIDPNVQLRQWLGLVDSIGNAANAFNQSIYYLNQTKRARAGLAADAGEAAAMALAEQFATDTVDASLITSLSDRPADEMPEALRGIVSSAAEAAAESSGVSQDERAPFMDAYSAAVMRHGIPWVTGMIQTQRVETASAMASDLAMNDTSVHESWDEYSRSPSLSGEGWTRFSESVLLPAIQRATLANDFHRVDEIYGQAVYIGEIDPRRPVDERTSKAYVAAASEYAKRQMEVAVSAIGSAVASAGGSTSDKQMSEAVSAFAEAIRFGGGSEDLHQAAGAAADELLSIRGYGVASRLWELIEATDERGSQILPPGHPVRAALHKAIERNKPDSSGETETTNRLRAESLMLSGIVNNMQPADIRSSLISEFGDGAGMRYFQNFPDIKEKFDRTMEVPDGGPLSRGIRAQIAIASMTPELDEVVESIHAQLGAGRLGPRDAASLIIEVEQRRPRLPFDWTHSDNTKRFNRELEEAFYGTTGDPIDQKISGRRDPEKQRKWFTLRRAAESSWKDAVKKFFDEREDTGSTTPVTPGEVDAVYQQWYLQNGMSFIDEAIQISQ